MLISAIFFAQIKTSTDRRTLTDARNNNYQFEYDLLDRRTKFIYPDASFEAWSYVDTADVNTPMMVYTGRDGSTMSCIHDNRGRETFCNYSDPLTPDVTYTYDDVGRMLTAATSAASHVYAYVDAGQLLSETTTPGGSTTSWTVAYTYDLDGNRASLTYPSGLVVDYTYTERNQLKEVVADGPPPLATYTYNANGQRISKALENGTFTTYEYDMANRLTEIEHSANGTPFYTVGYTLNSVGNRTSKSLSGSAVFNGPVTEVYDYDAIDQLIEADYGTGKIEDFQYDAVGNREQVELTESGSTTTTNYTANALNQYTAVGTDLPTYDARGNLTSQSGWTYAYDSKNRLLSATDGTTTASFVYDYRNRQVSRTIDGVTMYFVWDDWSLMEDRDGQLDVVQQYVHGPVIDEILVKIASEDSNYYHQDGLRSTVVLTDEAAKVREKYHYMAYGLSKIRNDVDVILSSSARGNRFTYTGRESVGEIALIDYRNRYYLSATGRFLQADPILFLSQDINLYRYTFGNPTVLIDPMGLKTEACCWEAYGNMIDAATMEFMAEGGSVASGFGLGTAGNAASGGLAAWSGNPWLMAAAGLNEIIQGGVSSYALGVEIEMYHTRIEIAEDILEDCLAEVQ